MFESTVLFVDDQEEIRFLIKRMLKDEPYNMLFAANGQEAIKVIDNNSVDVVVTDVLMPNMSGLELLDIIKKTHPNIVRIILSGFSQIPTLLSAINEGKIFRYITKPWQVDADAKAVIRDAIDYSHLLKSNQTQANGDISLQSFCAFLVKRQDIFVVARENKIVYVHPKLSDSFSNGQTIELKVLEGLGKVDTYEVISDMKVYLIH